MHFSKKSIILPSKENKLVLFEAIKITFCSGLEKLISIAKSGIIGQIKYVKVCFVKLV